MVLHFFQALKFDFSVLNIHADSMRKVQGPEDKDVVQEAKDIVDGHRDATLLLLWKILYGCELRHVRSIYRRNELTVHYSTLLYCTVLYCTVLYCTVLYCTVLYCTVLYCTVLSWQSILNKYSGTLTHVLLPYTQFFNQYHSW